MQPIFRHALAVLSAFAIAANALATIQRTFVASTGVDTNACSITAPCRGFAAAVAKTSNGQGGVNGINLLQPARPRIENCVISNMSGDGILHSAQGAELVVVDTTFRDNQGNGLDILGDG